jgi:hypothetical protein
MSSYFKYFPTIYYDRNNQNSFKEVVDITRRFTLIKSLLSDSTLYYPYMIEDQDRPDTIAEKIYNDQSLDWLVMITNDIYDINTDWYMSYEKFTSYLGGKYGSYEASTQQIHHYEWIIQPRVELYNGDVVEERVINIDETFFHTKPADDTRTVTCYDYEYDLNENRRTIKIIKEFYIRQILKEVLSIFKEIS